MFQFYNLMPTLTAQKNVELPLLLTKLSAAQLKRNAEIALELVGLKERGKHRPAELSGGQQQRVAIARAIVSDPTLLICDEPTGDLDRQSAEDILGLLRVLNREHGKTIVMVTHDPKAAEYATHTLHLDKGACWSSRSNTPDVFTSPFAQRRGGQGGCFRRSTAKKHPSPTLPCFARGGRTGRGIEMKYLHLIWAALFRSKTRTLLTLMSVVAAFLLFGMLDSVRVAFNTGGNLAGSKRLVVASRLSITQMLPYSLLSQIEAVPGVQARRLRGVVRRHLPRPEELLPQLQRQPELLRHVPGYVLPAAQKAAFAADRTGAIVGESLAKRNGWKLGDTVPLQATIFPQKDGSNAWPLKIDGIFTVKDAKRRGGRTSSGSTGSISTRPTSTSTAASAGTWSNSRT